MQSNQEVTAEQLNVSTMPKQQDGQKQQVTASEQQIPDHFYDSDLASINQKDFLSDNQPPKDQIQQRKLLYKEKMLHVFKTIVRLGENINKPARFDRISLKFKEVPQDQVVPRPLYKKDHKQQPIEDHPPYFSSLYLIDAQQIQYNLGKGYEQIERLVTSMKKGQTAVFQLEHLQTSKKSNIKVRRKVQAFVIGVRDWTTVIDLDCDGKFMKEVVRKGEGHSRISKHDEASFKFTLTHGSHLVLTQHHQDPVKLQSEYLQSMPAVLWKLMNSMKAKQWIRTLVTDDVMRQIQGQKYDKLLSKKQAPKQQHQDPKQQGEAEDKQSWLIEIQIFFFHSIDNILLDGRLLKKLITRGVSTAKPDPSSLVYYALRFLDSQHQVLHEDPCFNSDWWEDPSKLDLIGCRKHYLDDYSVSDMLRQVIERMKPAEVAQIQCRQPSFFIYGTDFTEYKTLTNGQPIPETIFMGVRVYNFIEGRNCFNMELNEKVTEARRKKAIGIVELNRGDLRKAIQTFQIIISFFSSGLIDQEAYDEKVSALMNCSLCHLKTQNFVQVLNFCNQVLQPPRHGYDPAKLKINGPGHAKIQGKLPEQPESDEREEALLAQNPKIIDKCLYRKAFALVKLGEGALAIECLKLVQIPTEQTQALAQQAEKSKADYEKKSVKMFKNMFG